MSKKYLIGNTESNTESNIESNPYKNNLKSNLFKGKLFINGYAYPVDIIEASLQIDDNMSYELGGNSKYIDIAPNKKLIFTAEINEPCLIEHASQSILEAINNNTINVI